MSMYKLIYDDLLDNYSVVRKSDGCTFVSYSNGNMDYEQFLQDVKEQGIGIVEGPDIVTPDYKQQRLTEYPSLTDQQDMQYWDAVNGTTTWKDKINEIKTKYPKTNTGSTTVGAVPSWVQTEVDKLNS